MVAVGQALMSNPHVLVIDELSRGLAPIVVNRLLALLERLAADGVAVLLIEQFASKALAVADTAYVMSGGELRHFGPAATLREDPERLAAAYLGRSVDTVG